MIRKLHIYIFATAALLAAPGCEKWLSMQPKSEIAAETLFKTPEGFGIALNGIYTNLSSPSLYSGELKYTFVDVLARCYELGNTLYNDLERYDYASVESNIQSMWSLAYNVIANCNSLLEELGKKGDAFFSPHERNMLEGEALAIRAMLYLDLVRLFAAAPVVRDEETIPYYDKLTKTTTPPLMKSSGILALAIADLERSRELQREFDTTDEARRWFIFPDRFRVAHGGIFDDGQRGFRMGYYAATALLARTALYAGNNRLAYDSAMELIGDTELLAFTSATIVNSNAYDRLLANDIIFALYRKEFEKGFNAVTFLVANTDAIFGTDVNDDYRKVCYLSAGDRLLKYNLVATPTDVTDKNREGYITSAIPMIRLSEMYHIAAEAIYDTDAAEAIGLLNMLREKRGCKGTLLPAESKNAMLDLLINDARREFLGEGQLFFMYKRLNRTILDEGSGNQTLTDKFIVPIPVRETPSNN